MAITPLHPSSPVLLPGQQELSQVPSSGNFANIPSSAFSNEAANLDSNVKHYKEEIPPLVADVDAQKSLILPPEVLKEAAVRGYIYNEDLLVFIKGEGKCKTLDQMVGKLKKNDPVDREAKRQGYTYHPELMIYLNDLGEGKIREEFEADLKNASKDPVQGSFAIENPDVKKLNDALDGSEREKIGFITDHLLQFDAWLKDLGEGGWHLNPITDIAISPNDQAFSYEAKLNEFFQRKEQFLGHLKSAGCHYDASCRTIFNGKNPATFEEVTKLVNSFLLPVSGNNEAFDKLKAGVIRPAFNINFSGLSDRMSIQCLFDVYINFEAYLKELKVRGWKIQNNLASFGDQTPRTLEDLKENVFEPVRGQFFDYLGNNRYSFSLDFKNGEFSFLRRPPVTLDEAIQLNDLFKPSIPLAKADSLSNHFEKIKDGLKPLVDYLKFVRVLESKGYPIDRDLIEDWLQQKEDTLFKFKEYGYEYIIEKDLFKGPEGMLTFEAVCDSLKAELLELVKERAEEQLTMKYDPVSKCFMSKYFIQDPVKKTVSDVMLEIMIQDFGLGSSAIG